MLSGWVSRVERQGLAVVVSILVWGLAMVGFGVAAFLLNVALGRLVTAQREQIAALKALGFPYLVARMQRRELDGDAVTGRRAADSLGVGFEVARCVLGGARRLAPGCLSRPAAQRNGQRGTMR